MLIIFLLEVLGDLKIQLTSIVNFYDRATPVKSKKRRLAMLTEPTILTISIGWKIFKKIVIIYKIINFKLFRGTSVEDSITCTDPKGSCARNVCECDKTFAVNAAVLYTHDLWDHHHHSHNFNRVNNNVVNNKVVTSKKNIRYFFRISSTRCEITKISL